MPGLPVLLADSTWLSYEGWLLFFKGTWVGLAVTAPPGPVSGLAVRRTLRRGLWQGLSTATGALLADVTLGSIAMLPASHFTGLGEPWDNVMSIVIAAVLIVLGVRYTRRAMAGVVFEDEPAPQHQRKAAGMVGMAMSTFLLTLMTPGTFPGFVILLTGLKLGERAKSVGGGAFLVLVGITVGALVWWLALCGLVHHFRAHAKKWERLLEYVCAGLMFVGAAFALWKGLLEPLTGE